MLQLPVHDKPHLSAHMLHHEALDSSPNCCFSLWSVALQAQRTALMLAAAKQSAFASSWRRARKLWQHLQRCGHRH